MSTRGHSSFWATLWIPAVMSCGVRSEFPDFMDDLPVCPDLVTHSLEVFVWDAELSVEICDASVTAICVDPPAWVGAATVEHAFDCSCGCWGPWERPCVYDVRVQKPGFLEHVVEDVEVEMSAKPCPHVITRVVTVYLHRDPAPCLAQPQPALVVTVENADDARRLCDATVTATCDGVDYVLQPTGDAADCAYEGPDELACQDDTYAIRAEHQGYTAALLDGVVVPLTADSCHRDTQRVTLSLERGH